MTAEKQGWRMERYQEFRPTPMDTKGLNLPDRQDWWVGPCARNRDSECWQESNWEAQLTLLGKESEDVEIHRFGHWANGWFEIVLIRPNSDAFEKAKEIEEKLENYPLLDEDDLSNREFQAAQDVWKDCYSPKQRIEYIRKHANQFDFPSISELMACVRGKSFHGYPSELLG